MTSDAPKEIARIVCSAKFERFLIRCKKSNRDIFRRVGNQMEKIVREPNIGKPLRYTLKNRRRLHIGSFVLVYEIYDGELRFIDCDHHDKIYKNY